MSVVSSGMLRNRALELSEVTKDVLKFYGTLVDDIPYQSFTLAVVERNRPEATARRIRGAQSASAGHAHCLALRSAYFSEFPEFFVAHEAAHQWGDRRGGRTITSSGSAKASRSILPLVFRASAPQGCFRQSHQPDVSLDD